MKAVVLEGKYKIIVTDVPDPKIESPADPIIKIITAGICVSDLPMYEGRSMGIDDAWSFHGLP